MVYRSACSANLARCTSSSLFDIVDYFVKKKEKLRKEIDLKKTSSIIEKNFSAVC